MSKRDPDICDIHCIHGDLVRKMKKNMLDEQTLGEVSSLFRVMGDSTRISIIHILIYQPMCVCDIAGVLNMTQSAVSHQLRVLKQAKLVKSRREGKVVYYSLDDEHILDLFRTGLEHIRHG